ncbi:MAG: response regulator transcription factor [Acidobacteriota bacterium]
MPTESHVIVIEPERALLDAICFHFQMTGYACLGVTSPDRAVGRLSERRVDLVVMDFGADGPPTRELPHPLAKMLSDRTRLLLLASRKDDPRVLTALERYADDFVTKPINVPELLARGRALIRRTRLADPGRQPEVVTRGSLTLDPTRRRVDIGGVEVKMTNREFRLLYTLVSRPGVVFTRQEILDTMWGSDRHLTPRCVDALVKRVRRRVAAVSPVGVPLQTIRGVGYRFARRGSAPARSRTAVIAASHTTSVRCRRM